MAFSYTTSPAYHAIAENDDTYGLGTTGAEGRREWYRQRARLANWPREGMGPSEWTDVFLSAGYYVYDWDYLAQVFGGIPMSQSEFVRLPELGLTDDEIDQARTASVDALIAGNDAATRARLAARIAGGAGADHPEPGLAAAEMLDAALQAQAALPQAVRRGTGAVCPATPI